MDPLTLSAIIGGAGSLASIGGSLFSAGQQRENQQGNLQMAMQNYMLQKQMAEAQQRLAEAGRTDAAGNQVYFNGKDWVTAPTEATKGIISASQKNEREQQVKGGYRREAGQQQNFEDRGNARNLAQATLRELQSGIGKPTLEGVSGRNAVAAATRVGANRDSLVDAVSRNLIRSGGGGPSSDASLAGLDDAAGRSMRVALADSEANAPEQYRQQLEGWETGRLNKFAPLNAIGSNITDAPFAATKVGDNVDASLNQAASYGAATSGRGGPALNQAGALVSGASNISPMPWGPAAGALTDSVLAYLKRTGGGNSGTSPITRKSSVQEYF